MTHADFAVIGAGQAGLAAGYYLRRTGADFFIVDGADHVGGSWPHYYDSLRLFSPFRYSALPGLPIPGSPYAYPHRDDITRYLQDYARTFSFPLKLGLQIKRIERGAEGFHLQSASGDKLTARKLIVAAGAFGAPHIPQIDDASSFSGRILHSSNYRRPDIFAGQRIIVVGAGNSAVQIAVELAAEANVTLAVRNPLRFLPQSFLGKDVHWWFDKLRLNRANLFSDHGVPVVDDGRYRRAIKQGRPPSRPMFKAFFRDGVIWNDGEYEKIDQVIFATGFQAALEFLDGTGALAPDGRPLHKRGVSETVRGLGFVGLSGQNGFASATLRGVGPDAQHVVDQLLKL